MALTPNLIQTFQQIGNDMQYLNTKVEITKEKISAYDGELTSLITADGNIYDYEEENTDTPDNNLVVEAIGKGEGNWIKRELVTEADLEEYISNYYDPGDLAGFFQSELN